MTTQLYTAIGAIVLLAIIIVILNTTRSKKQNYSYQKKDLFTRNELSFYKDLLPVASAMNLRPSRSQRKRCICRSSNEIRKDADHSCQKWQESAKDDK